MGNSTLELGVDLKQFVALSRKSIYAIVNSGSSTALWYLILKNNIEDSSFKPKDLVIFFTDTLLTYPGDRVTGKYFPIIDEYASSYDELLINLSYRNQLTSLEKALISLLPLYGYREMISDSIKNTMEYALTTATLDCPFSCMQGITDDVFKFINLLPSLYGNKLDATPNSYYTWKQLNFNGNVTQSYLPEMIRICKKNNIHLIMVRMGTRQFLSQVDEPLWVRAYFRALESYLTENGVGYLDLAHDSRIKPELYFDFVHLTEKGRQVFTQALVEKLEPLLK
jgi:hypothetical protein